MDSASVYPVPVILKQGPVLVCSIVIGIASAIYLARRLALPTPIPGIPYNEPASRNILGDAVEVRALKAKGVGVRTWFLEQAIKHNSPVIQLFLAPFAKPTILVSDYWEVQDILLRRQKEFDKGGRITQAFAGIIPHHHIAMETLDPHFKSNRELVKDLMTPAFLEKVVAPRTVQTVLKFIDLWRLKSTIANGLPFDAKHDTHAMTFDAIKASSIGGNDDESLLVQYFQVLESQVLGGERTRNLHNGEIAGFPPYPPDKEVELQRRLQLAAATSLGMPSPRLYHAMNNLTKSMREAYQDKTIVMDQAVNDARKNIESGQPVHSAVEFILLKQISAAKKTGQSPDYDSPYVKEELLGFIGAGHETSDTTFQWGLKFLTANQDAQHELQRSLRAAYVDADREGRQPNAEELTKASVPYLDAVVEEILRLATPIRTSFRVAKSDTTILGHRITKGTQVLLATYGASINVPGFQIPENLRSTTSKTSRSVTAPWSSDDVREFKPERWLMHDNGELRFNPQAGPALPFSMGLRGCYGKRLAYLQLKIIIALFAWNLELLPLPDELHTFDEVDALTTKPRQCFVKLREIGL